MLAQDSAGMLIRLKALLPVGWFGDVTPTLDAVLGGPAWAMAQAAALISYVAQQTRIATASGRNLDFIAGDFLGQALPRRSSENDTSYRSRIKAAILQPRATRAAVRQALLNLTGNVPAIFEPTNTGDAGGWTSGANWAGLAYGSAGGYGSLHLPYQCLVSIQLPIQNGGVANVDGYGGYLGGYGVGAVEYITPDQITAQVTDADIYRTVAATMPAATTAWVRILPA